MNENILNNNRIRRPDWLKVKIKVDDDFNATKRLMTSQSLHTVCEEAEENSRRELKFLGLKLCELLKIVAP